jgi:TonB family protein
MNRCVLITLLYCIFCSSSSVAQTADRNVQKYGKDLKMPVFEAGDSCFNQFFAHNVHYPDQAREANIDGRVVVRVYIDENGAITEAEILRGIGGGCEEEALRIVKLMPRWTPARYKGKKVGVYMLMKMLFKLE